MSSRDKHKGKRPEADPAMVEVGRLKNSLVQFSQTDRNSTLVRADELDGVEVRQNLIKDGPNGPPSRRALFHLGPDAKRVTFDNVRFTGSGYDSFVSGTDAEYLCMTGCSMDSEQAPRAEPHRTKSSRTIFLPPAVSLVPSREEQRRTGNYIGRNEPCPCGVAKKYKHCHGKIT